MKIKPTKLGVYKYKCSPDQDWIILQLHKSPLGLLASKVGDNARFELRYCNGEWGDEIEESK